MEALVRYQLESGVATISMDDGKANAISVDMLQQLNAALDRAQADKAVVVLAGRGRIFCGGFDLSVFSRGRDEMVPMLEGGARLTERLLSFPLPVIAACTGHAVAMGTFLLLSTDVRIGVDQGARIHVNEVQIGMTLPRFAIEVCRQRLAPAHLNQALITGEPYSPQQAVVAGFLDDIVPAESVLTAARSRAAALVKLPGEAFVANKLRVRRNALEALREAIRDDMAEWTTRASGPS